MGYAQALQNNLETTKSMHQLMRTAFDAKTPRERLDSRVAAMETRLNALKDMQPALSTCMKRLTQSSGRAPTKFSLSLDA